MPRETAAGSGAATTVDLSFLRKGHWFGALPPDLQALIFERSSIRSYRKGARLVSEATPCRGLFVVVLGRVHVVRRLGDSPDTLIHVGEAGFWFGEYALLSGQLAIASVVAASNAKVLLLPAAEFGRIVAEQPGYYPHFTRLLTERFATVFRYASEARAVAAEEWLRTRLNGLAESRLDAPGVGPVEITVSQAELATMVGVSRQTLCMLLGRLQARGLVEVGYRRVRVLART